MGHRPTLGRARNVCRTGRVFIGGIDMKKAKLPPRPPAAKGWSPSGLPLAFWGARHHPKESARHVIAATLEEWAELKPGALENAGDGWSVRQIVTPAVAPLVLE